MYLLTIENNKMKCSVEGCKTIYQVLIENNIQISSNCGGVGNCNKCNVILLNKNNKNVLSCKYEIDSNLEIYIEKNDEQFEILDVQKKNRKVDNGYKIKKMQKIKIEHNVSREIRNKYKLEIKKIEVYRKLSKLINNENEEIYALVENDEVVDISDIKNFKPMGIAIDIGTTTIAFNLIDLLTGEVVEKISMINNQRIYGADVISRIMKTMEGHLKELNEIIIDNIKSVIEGNFSSRDIKTIVISGNTTMIHFLLNIECENIGISPFNTTFTDIGEFSYKEVFSSDIFQSKVVIMPAISAFVGGDIISGLLFSDFVKTPNNLFLDLGTNAEIALYDGDEIWTTSAPAGPAFEGGNISCGTGSVAGSINKVEFYDNEFNYKTIGNKKPIGICGSGLIDIISILIKNNFVDKNGTLIERYIDEGIGIAGDIKITQKDIREFQMAKAAIITGFEILIDKSKINFNDVENLYISGGFGFKINIENAVNVGLIPKELLTKVKVIGNTSLGGAVDYLLYKNAKDKILKLQEMCREINLSKEERFSKIFIDKMCFEI